MKKNLNYLLTNLLTKNPSPSIPLPRRGKKVSFAKQTVKNLSPITHSPVHPSPKRKAAFTLGEVLITLAIIGVVAVLVLPGMLQNYNERKTVTKLKQTYSILNQAIQQMIMEHGYLNQWEDDSFSFFEQELMKHLKVVGQDTCPYYRYMLGLCTYMPVPHKYILANGVAVGVKTRISNASPTSTNFNQCSRSLTTGSIHYGYCASIFVDVNNMFKPNKEGLDAFEFRVYTNGILPKGHVEANSNDGFNVCWRGYNENCTAWVVYHGNMDYTKCRGKLGWNGPYSCKEAEE